MPHGQVYESSFVNDPSLKGEACSWLTPAPAEAGEAALLCAD